MKRIAVWNTAFLGDAVLTLPLIQTLADAFPGSEIDFYVRRGLASLFEAHPALHAVYEYDKRRIAGNNRLSALLKTGRILGGRRYDIWIGAHPSPRSALLARLSGAPLRVGYIGGPVAALCYNRRVSRRFSELHEIERLLELLKPILPPETPRQHWPELTLPSAALEKAAALPRVAPARRSGTRPARAASRFGLGHKTLAAVRFCGNRPPGRRPGVPHVLVFAGPGEEGVARDVIALSELKGNPLLHDLSCALTLPELAAYLRMLNCYVSNDSGPMHLAWAQHTRLRLCLGRRCASSAFSREAIPPRSLRFPLSAVPAACTGRITARRNIIAAWSTSTLKPCGAMWRESWGCRGTWGGGGETWGLPPSPENFSSPLPFLFKDF